MPTFNQILKRARVKNKTRVTKQRSTPQKKGIVTSVFTMSPKKPNSAIRKLCSVTLANGQRIRAYIRGEGHKIQEHASVLVAGGSRADLPSVKHMVVRGALDAAGVEGAVHARSKKGTNKAKK